jgi:hypothetical protein
MRTIKKSITVKTVEQTLYNRTAKLETTRTFNVSEAENEPTLPENCVLLEQKTVSEKEVVYQMSPETFVKHATIVEE